MTVVVDCKSGTISFAGESYSCVIGRGGAVSAAGKAEGDGCTPLGRWPLRGAIIRPGAGFEPPHGLPWRWMRKNDGWCDDVASEAYNRPVDLPCAGSSEALLRSDSQYDAVFIIGYNDKPAVEGVGSAIFLHLRDSEATAGCVAVDPEAMHRLLAYARDGYEIEIRLRGLET